MTAACPTASNYLLPASLIFFGLTAQYLICIRRELPDFVLFCLGVLPRLLLLGAPIVLTSDIYRYLWEGQVFRHGVNPYQFAPAHPDITYLRTSYFSCIEHAHLSAIYPPLSQVLLALFAFSPLTWKIFLLGTDCASFFTLRRIRTLYQSQGYRFSIAHYWLLPLGIIEVAWSGHLEGPLVLLLLLCWLQVKHFSGKSFTKSIGLGVLIGIAGLIKYHALFIAPILCVELFRKDRKNVLPFCVSLVLTVGIGALPFLDRSLTLFSSLFVYLQHWRYNDSLLHLLGSVFSVDWQDLRTFRAFKLALLGLWLCLYFFLLRQKRDFSERVALIFASYFLCTAVVHPWYLLCFAPFLTVRANKALLLFCLLIPLSYYATLSNIAFVPVWLKMLIYAPVYTLLLVHLVKSSEPSENLESARNY